MFGLFKPKPRPLPPLLLTNTLSGKKEPFAPLRPGEARIYSCGPTVYDRAHIGNLRPYVVADILARTLALHGYTLSRVVNITDIGHLVGDGDDGADKVEEAARKEGVSPSDIAERYARLFREDVAKLNADGSSIRYPKASEYVREQIALVETLEKTGHAYRTKDGLYFDTRTFPGYGKLGNLALSGQKGGARVAVGEKRHAEDFALWKLSPSTQKAQRLQEWQSPWGTGFPGWHIECSAMARALLGDTIDIHTGGMDHVAVHHNNEIAQSESATGRPLARYWLHTAFLTDRGEKISKSLGNTYSLDDLAARGIEPLALRYLFLGAHYRTPLSFSWESLEAAGSALRHLRGACLALEEDERARPDPESLARFAAAVSDDLGTPRALAVAHEVVRDDTLDEAVRRTTLGRFDEVLGLSLFAGPAEEDAPEEVLALVRRREDARSAKDFATADALRAEIATLGYELLDTPEGPVARAKGPR